MTECRPRRAGGLLRARKKSHTPAAGAGLPAGGPGKGSSRCGWWCAHMKGYYERTKKKKPVDRVGALIYGRLIFVSRVSNMFDNPTSPKCLRSVRNWYDARRRVYTGNEFIQEPKKSRQA